MATMRAVRCARCQEPTGSFFDSDAEPPPFATCDTCDPLENTGGPATAPPPLGEDEEAIRECDGCGGTEFEYTERWTSYVHTGDGPTRPGETITFGEPQVADGSGEAMCISCGRALENGTWDIY